MTKSDDAALYERWLTARDGEAFAELARRHAPIVFDLAARTLGDRTAAEDVVQEALLDLAVETTRKPVDVGVPAWLVRFAICRARNQRSSERSRARRQIVVGMRRPEECMPDERLETGEELEHALASAEPEERAVLAMRYLHGWDYEEIATALATSEGAARVRVHRALANLRGRLGVAEKREAAVTRKMSAVALIPLPAARLDSAIRLALDAAGVGGPAPAAPAPSGLRAALSAIGASLLLVGASAASLQIAASGASDGLDRGTATAVLAGDLATASSFGGKGSSAGAASLRFGAPRPEDWDGGALARLSRGDSSPEASRPSPRSVEPPKAADAAPAAAPVVVPAIQEQRPSSAFRPHERGASAANCDPGPSDDGRADALGGFFRPAAAEAAPVAPASPEAAPTPDGVVPETTTRRRAAAPRDRAVPVLDEAALALVDQAAELVRDVVERSAAESVADDASATAEEAPNARRARARGAQAVKRQFQSLARADEGERKRVRSAAARRKLAKMKRVLALLVEYSLDDRTAGAIRWPDGMDITAALQEVVRVLSAVPVPTPVVPTPAEPASNDPAVALPEVP